jgi:hypoxanthine-DNA glycosylase
MDNIFGFPPIAKENAKILILGSMPSDVSLQKQQYYGHQRNAFWPIILSLFSEVSSLEGIDYSQRKELLIEKHIAVWDVLQHCVRAGSLDTAIKMDSIKVNDFYQFFSDHKAITKVCFNGAKAEGIYVKYVLPHIKDQFDYLQYVRLPSTSPAHAAMTLDQKKEVWGNEIKTDCAKHIQGINYN